MGGGIKYSQIPWIFAYFTPKNFRPPSAAGGAREKHKRGKTHRNTTDWYFYSFLWFTFENNMEITHFFGLFLKLNFSYSFLRVTISLLKIFRLRRYSFLRVTISLDQIVIIFVTQITHFFGLPFLRERTVHNISTYQSRNTPPCRNTPPS